MRKLFSKKTSKDNQAATSQPTSQRSSPAPTPALPSIPPSLPVPEAGAKLCNPDTLTHIPLLFKPGHYDLLYVATDVETSNLMQLSDLQYDELRERRKCCVCLEEEEAHGAANKEETPMKLIDMAKCGHFICEDCAKQMGLAEKCMVCGKQAPVQGKGLIRTNTADDAALAEAYARKGSAVFLEDATAQLSLPGACCTQYYTFDAVALAYYGWTQISLISFLYQ